MTEKRIDCLARMIINHKVVGIGRTKSFLRAVAYEGRAEGWETGIEAAATLYANTSAVGNGIAKRIRALKEGNR